MICLYFRVLLSDGASTHVIINQVHRKELGQPYGPCLKRNDEHSDLLDDLQVNPSAPLKMLKKICIFLGS